MRVLAAPYCARSPQGKLTGASVHKCLHPLSPPYTATLSATLQMKVGEGSRAKMGRRWGDSGPLEPTRLKDTGFRSALEMSLV